MIVGKTLFALLWLMSSIGHVAGPVSTPAEERSDVSLQQWSDAIRAAAAQIETSVVTIETIGGAPPSGRDLSALGSRFRVADGPTTGIIVSEDGLILTSSFNFVRDPAVIMVTLLDGRKFLGRLLGRNRVLKLALIQIEAIGLPAVEWVAEDTIHVGQAAIALGRGFGTTESAISMGIISAVGRMAGHAVQTDAKLSPANYGGPLIDLDGRVLGLCVPMALQPGELAGVEWYDAGIGFAIPHSIAAENVELLRRVVEIERGYIGIEMADTPEPGVLIRRIAEDSPAESVGLLAGDRIIRINGNPVLSRLDLLRALNVQAAGHQIEMVVQRNEERIPVSLTLGRFDDIGFDRFVRPTPPSPETQPAETPESLADAPLPDGPSRPE